MRGGGKIERKMRVRSVHTVGTICMFNPLTKHRHIWMSSRFGSDADALPWFNNLEISPVEHITGGGIRYIYKGRKTEQRE